MKQAIFRTLGETPLDGLEPDDKRSMAAVLRHVVLVRMLQDLGGEYVIGILGDAEATRHVVEACLTKAVAIGGLGDGRLHVQLRDVGENPHADGKVAE